MIEAERLTLRRFQLADAAPLAAYRNDPDIARYQAWPSPLTPETATTRVRKYREQDRE